jgi:5-methylcytosine-specific restriction protein A
MPNKTPVFGSAKPNIKRFGERKSASERGYDHNWSKLRAWKLAKDPICHLCDLRGRVTAADTVHHINEVETNPELRLDPENLMSLCRECHETLHGRLNGRGESDF